MSVVGPRPAVLLAAGGAEWEVEAVRLLSGAPGGAVLLKRCVDLADLLASAATGQASIVLVACSLPGLDVESMSLLRRSGVSVLLVAEADGEGVALPGAFAVLDPARIADLPALLPAAVASAESTVAPAGLAYAPADGAPRSESLPGPAAGPATGQGAGPDGTVVAVWGPTGAPGRTTVAVGVAAELARRGHDVLLVDADGYGGAVAQHLGILDEASGLLGAVRAANVAELDLTRLAAVARTVSPGLRVLTGLPRADRWAEVRPAAFDTLLETARELCRYVVLDLGFSLEQEPAAYGSSAPQRNHMTIAGLEQADEVLVVGSADPVGLARLARALVELPDVVPAGAPRVVVNRTRASLGWAEHEVRAMVEGFVVPTGTHFLPDDPAATDRALVAGRTLPEVGESALAGALAGLAGALDGTANGPGPRAGRWLRLRRAGRAR